MSPQCTKHPKPVPLSWFQVPAQRVTLYQLEKNRERKRLERFRRHLHLHDIPYFGRSYKVLVRRLHSRQFFSTSLGALLSLDYAPHKVKIPSLWFSHLCQYFWQVDKENEVAHHFQYVLEVHRTRGRPCRADSNDSSSDDSDNSSFNDSDTVHDTSSDNSDTL